MRKRKIFTFLLTIVLTLCTCIGFVGCKGNETPKDGKYDVSIRVVCDDGGSWDFSPDVDEIRIERNYDGREHRYYVGAYQLAEHPQFGDSWLTPSGEGANVFHSNLAYRDENGKVSEVKKVKERGEYCLNVNASQTSTLWNIRRKNNKKDRMSMKIERDGQIRTVEFHFNLARYFTAVL